MQGRLPEMTLVDANELALVCLESEFHRLNHIICQFAGQLMSDAKRENLSDLWTRTDRGWAADPRARPKCPRVDFIFSRLLSIWKIRVPLRSCASCHYDHIKRTNLLSMGLSRCPRILKGSEYVSDAFHIFAKHSIVSQGNRDSSRDAARWALGDSS
jgi:hypothetical protein